MVRGSRQRVRHPVIPIPDWVAHRARTRPDDPALASAADDLISYADFDLSIGRTAAALAALGAEPGSPVALLAGSGRDFAVLAHAIPRSGAILMPLNTRLTTGELAYQLGDAGARLLLADAAQLDRARVAAATIGARVIAIESDLAGIDAVIEGAESIDPEAVHSLIYTSGTTGSPKGALLTHGNFYWSAVASGENLGVDPMDRWLACMPLFHVGGLSILTRSAIYGSTAVIHDGFDEVRVNQAIRHEEITLLSVVAVMLRRMLDADDEPYPASMRAVLVGGGPVPVDLLIRARDRGLPVLQTYGLTETASQVATLSAADALRKPGSSGLPLLTTTIRIDSEGRAAEPGEIGEILVAGPTVTAGYLGHPEATAEAICDGWLHTGDLGSLDDDGYLYIADRRDDLIVTGGENVYPAEVEAALTAHEAILEAAVVGLPDDRWGQLVAAVVVVERSEVAPSPEALAAQLRQQLAGYKVPRRIEFSSEVLPRTASGKLQRHLVRAALQLATAC
jgi:O-succinylbenzoic acid--CoA ligase